MGPQAPLHPGPPAQVPWWVQWGLGPLHLKIQGQGVSFKIAGLLFIVNNDPRNIFGQKVLHEFLTMV